MYVVIVVIAQTITGDKNLTRRPGRIIISFGHAPKLITCFDTYLIHGNLSAGASAEPILRKIKAVMSMRSSCYINNITRQCKCRCLYFHCHIYLIFGLVIIFHLISSQHSSCSLTARCVTDDVIHHGNHDKIIQLGQDIQLHRQLSG